MINVSPIGRSHVLLVPQLSQMRPQRLDRRGLQMMLHCLLLSRDRCVLVAALENRARLYRSGANEANVLFFRLSMVSFNSFHFCYIMSCFVFDIGFAEMEHSFLTVRQAMSYFIRWAFYIPYQQDHDNACHHSSGLRGLFNSLGALASVNHYHLHLYRLHQPLYIETAVRDVVFGVNPRGAGVSSQPPLAWGEYRPSPPPLPCLTSES